MALNELNIQWSTTNQVVAGFSNGKFFSDPAFKNRVLLPNKSLEKGDFSLTINPTFYSDYGHYECYQAKTLIRKWLLNITVSYSTEVHVSVGSTAILPCYSHVDRQLDSNNIDVQWKKGDTKVLDFHNGKMDRDSEYSFRTILDVESVPKGVFSMSITETKTSDSGHYQCQDHYHGILSIISLDVYEENILKLHLYDGESLKILIPPEEVQIEFINGDSPQWLCSIFVDWASCKKDTYARYKYKNGHFSVGHLTKADEGRYTVKTANGYRKIKEVYVQVASSPPIVMYTCWSILCLILLVSICIQKRFWPRAGTIKKKDHKDFYSLLRKTAS
ncbi:uncharacterized protein LOC143527795 [Brachyhypopomus gauderio]|uniref:uncharacterized protein LOC143527795 n=1 Tax=Brachyhypopomus gauderio TaxID=698409 RepID=UPI004041277F